MEQPTVTTRYALDWLQRTAVVGMTVLLLLTFMVTNLQALLWQSSEWLVGAVLPAVVVDLTNEERGLVSAVPLRRNAILDGAATAKAKHMADNEYFAHYAPDGTTPWEFFDDAGYVYAHAGENLAIHFSDSIEVVEAWMKSPAHRANIIDGKFTEIGVGTARGTFEGYPTVYVVQLFGTPAIPPVVVASEADSVTESATTIPSPLTPQSSPLSQALPDTEQVAEGLRMTQREALAVIPAPAPLPLEDLMTLATTTPTSTLRTSPLATAVPEQSDSSVAPSGPLTTVLGATEEMLSQPEEIRIAPPALMSDADFSVPTERPAPPHAFYSQLATSSGLLVSTSEQPTSTHAGATITALATQPSIIFESMYRLVAVGIIGLLLLAVVYETRRRRFIQVMYSGALFVVLIGLWYVHTLLTAGAVII